MIQAEDVIRYSSVTGVQTCSLFFQAEDGIRDSSVTGVQTCCFPFQAEDGIRDSSVTGVQTCALPISVGCRSSLRAPSRQKVGAPTPAKVSLASWPLARALTLPVAAVIPYGPKVRLEMPQIGRASCRERV